ncbi:MAG: hypothetical protein Q4G14_10175 [Paracoccus sp. (in: a-proteobacteria)]|uniref:hypothetical protein n=1 Tax=Paracoccus sp. TaxID=267 RepID=UPI0026DEFFA3|nr:hypothetical protein [Paracoccus sp. (in: a-proteobacteria)]MDO5613590.1 hypothetical protein [Paracoccus sp. (in: a-proteobacteria)]
MTRIFLIIACLFLPAQVLAGAWPREPGGVFLSLSAERDRDNNHHTGLYAEYGLSARRTLGVELGHTRGEQTVLVWMQHAFGDDSARHRWSVMAGSGVIRRGEHWLPHGQLGASWGRGFQGIAQGGWLSADSRLGITGKLREEWDIAANGGPYLTPETMAKLNLTAGLRLDTSWMVINQLRLEHRDDSGFSSRLAVSVVRDLAGPAKLELGAIQPLSGQGERAIKLGTWLEF